MQLTDLIDKAASALPDEQNRTVYALAKYLGTTPNVLYDVRAERKPCPPDLIASMADLAGENAAEWLLTSLSESLPETRKGHLRNAMTRWRLEEAGNVSVGALVTLAGFGASALALGAGSHGFKALMAAVTTMCVMSTNPW